MRSSATRKAGLEFLSCVASLSLSRTYRWWKGRTNDFTPIRDCCSSPRAGDMHQARVEAIISIVRHFDIY